MSEFLTTSQIDQEVERLYRQFPKLPQLNQLGNWETIYNNQHLEDIDTSIQQIMDLLGRRTGRYDAKNLFYYDITGRCFRYGFAHQFANQPTTIWYQADSLAFEQTENPGGTPQLWVNKPDTTPFVLLPQDKAVLMTQELTGEYLNSGLTHGYFNWELDLSGGRKVLIPDLSTLHTVPMTLTPDSPHPLKRQIEVTTPVSPHQVSHIVFNQTGETWIKRNT